MDKDFLKNRLNELRDQNLMYSHDRLLAAFGDSDYYDSHQVISFSGGRSSAFMTLELKKLFPDIPVVFCDTGAEHPKTYKFIREFSKHFNIDITCLRTKVNKEFGKGCRYTEIGIEEIGYDLKPYTAVVQKYGVPFVTGSFCTDRLKTKPFQTWCKDNFDNKPYRVWLGIRIDDPKRFNKLKNEKYLYLADISDYEKEDILYFWKQQGVDLEIAEHLANCVFCVKKSCGKIGLAIKDEPKMAEDFIKMIRNAPSKYADQRDKNTMYRGRTSLEALKDIYSSMDRDKLVGRLHNSKQYETECSDSCEIQETD